MKTIIAALGASLLAALPAVAQPGHVPITYRQTSGTRPYVPVLLDGHPFLFMVHAQASFHAMTTHANAATAGVTDLVQVGNYGITAVGKRSTLGKAKAKAATFEVGGATTRDMPLTVFEIPQDPPVDGMIGIEWLRSSGTFVDYARGELVVPHEAGDADAERAELLRQGYVAHPMAWNAATKQYTVHPVVAGVPVTYRVSTVASDVMDEPFARAHGVALVADKGEFGGPTGTTGAVYHTSGPYPFVLDGHPFKTASADVFDTYKYEASPRPAVLADGIAGTIGCDFMRSNGAVIDFGSGTLFLKA